MKRTFEFLLLEEHPYGRDMLRQLLDAGLVPQRVIEEVGELADLERKKFLVRLEGFDVAPTITELVKGTNVARERVPHHNSEMCRALLAESSPDLLVLGGTRILEDAVIASARDGCLNSHPGLLPEVRGSASVAWAIQRDLPIGCTCHFIDSKIDQGPIVARREIPVHRSDTYEKLCFETVRLSGALMVEAVDAWRRGELRATPQGAGGETHKNMPDEMVEGVKRKLAEGRYARFVD